MKKTQINEKKRLIDKKKVKYECKICDYISSNKTDYERHLKTKKPIKLKIRGNAFPTVLEKNAKNNAKAREETLNTDKYTENAQNKHRKTLGERFSGRRIHRS